MGRWRRCLPVALGLLLHSGCMPSVPSSHYQRPAAPAGVNPESFPVCERGRLGGELLVPLPLTGAGEAGPPAPQPQYRLLQAHQAQCQAVKESALANALDLEAQGALQRAAAQGRGCANQDAELLAQILAAMALVDRNRSAAQALDVYYRLGEAEANGDVVQSMLRQVKDALVKVRELKAKGLEVPLDDTTLYRQQLDLQTRAVQLEMQIRSLNSDLRRHLDLDPCAGEWRAWPADAFSLPTGPVEQDAVAVGLASRPDLRVLALLEVALNSGKLEMVRQGLRTLGSALGQGPRAASCPCLAQLRTALCRPCDEGGEEEVRAQQLAQLRARREREAVEEINQAAQTVQGQKAVVQLVQQRARSWQQRVKEEEEKEAKGVGSFAALTEARLEYQKALGKVVEEMTNLQRAWVKLRQTQGVLPLDCPPAAGEPSCRGAGGSPALLTAGEPPAPRQEKAGQLPAPRKEGPPAPGKATGGPPARQPGAT